MTIEELKNKSIEEVRNYYCKLTGVDADVANMIKGKKNILDRIVEFKEACAANELIGEDFEIAPFRAEMNSTAYQDNPPKEPSTASQIGGEGWTEYVMSLFTKDELDTKDKKSYPKANGLRRVAQLILGPIIKSGPVQVFPPSGPKNQTTIVYEVVFDWTYDNVGQWMTTQSLHTPNIRTFSEIADSNNDNTPPPFNLHPSATAASRAEGRALRKALQLNVYTAEEMNAMQKPDVGNGIVQLPTSDEHKPIQDIQKVVINNVAGKLKIDLAKTLELHRMGTSLDSLSANQAAEFISILAKYQSNAPDALNVPDFIKVGQ